MRCPKCKAEELTESEAGRSVRQIKNLGGKRYHPSFNTRRYKCSECGFAYVTVEKYHRDISPRDPLPDAS